MNARLAVGWLAATVLCAACATSSGTGARAAAKSEHVGAVPVAGSGPAAATATPTTAAPTIATPAADTTSSARAGGSADPGLPAKTPAEQRAAIDSRLDASLASFDNRLRTEQQQTAANRDTQTTSDAAVAAVDPLATPGGERRGDRDEIRRDRSGDLQSVGVQQASATGQQGSGTNGASATPIPSGADDDIVARRLRRAAEDETDPELKEKLWKEYRDYKENTKGST